MKESDKFIYKLLVNDLQAVVDEYTKLKESVDEQRKQELKERFTKFTLDVLQKALEYSTAGVKDKWLLMKNYFEERKSKYLGVIEKNEKEEKPPLDLKYMLRLAASNQNIGEKIRTLEDEYGRVVSVKRRGKRDTNKFRYDIWTTEGGNKWPVKYSITTGKNVDKSLLLLLEALQEHAKQQKVGINSIAALNTKPIY
jgi:hypothetical protein